LLVVRRRTVYAFVLLIALSAAALAAALSRPSARPAQGLYRTRSFEGKTIVIDPGHGGRDPGAVGHGGLVVEKEVTLGVALHLARFVEGAGGRAVLTRSRDEDPGAILYNGRTRKQRELARRVEIANSSGGCVLVSIHANDFPSSRWRGAQVFYRGDAGPAAAELAACIQGELRRVLGNTERLASPSADQYLLRYAEMPSATVEVGFLSNPAEERLLADDEYRRRVAWAIFLGLARYISRVEGGEAPGGGE